MFSFSIKNQNKKLTKQETKFGSEFSDFLNTLFGVPQVSVLGPILFIMSKIVLFFI